MSQARRRWRDGGDGASELGGGASGPEAEAEDIANSR